MPAVYQISYEIPAYAWLQPSSNLRQGRCWRPGYILLLHEHQSAVSGVGSKSYRPIDFHYVGKTAQFENLQVICLFVD
jgi:hypothetical protein